MFVKDIRLQIALTLFAVSLISLLRFFSFKLLFIFLSLLVAAQLIEFFLVYILEKKKPFLSYSAVISALLIFLLLDKSTPIWVFIVASILAIASKHIIKIDTRHIFNPAAFGAFLASFLPRASISWWGVAWNPLLSVIVILGCFFILKRLRRLYIVGGFLVIYLLYYIFTTGSLLGVKALIDGTVILFAFIMLPEPQTTPIANYWLKSFGLFVSILMVIILKLFPSISSDPLVLSLLFADLISFIIIKFTSQKITR